MRQFNVFVFQCDRGRSALACQKYHIDVVASECKGQQQTNVGIEIGSGYTINLVAVDKLF